jgi:GT2 family glycosyltransferase
MSEPKVQPAISVVLPTTSDFESIATTVRHLRRQSVADRLELVVVAMARPDFLVDASACRGFWGVRVVHTDRHSHGDACAAGVRAARASVVVFAEDHCFPEPGWAEALLAAYTDADVVAVGPIFRNANPSTLVSWCDFVIGYGPWIDPQAAADQPFLAGHNSSYRREVLLALGERLAEALDSETVLHLELRSRGRRLVLEPRARAAHTNFGRLDVWFPVQYHCGRVFAAERARRWGWPRRVFYAAASPLIPCVRFVRALRQLRRSPERRPALLRLAPLLALGLGADGTGQMIGYLAGGGASPRYLTGFEFRRMDFVPESDRHLWHETETRA